jgi:NADH:ubiquinone oxidoreductase subunit
MKKLLNMFLGVQSSLSFMLSLFLKGRFIGIDQFGNKYYKAKARRGYNHERRWVKFKSGHVEATEIPPEFHGWIHHQTDVFPSFDGQSYRQAWQIEHTPNLTGTTLAYRPDGHQLKGGKRQKATGDYEAWTPQ